MDPGASRRLSLALAASLALHWSLLYTVQVVPPLPPAAAALQARLALNDAPLAPPPTTTRSHLTRHAAAVRDEPAAELKPIEQAAATVAAAPTVVGQPVSDARAPLPALEVPLPIDTTWYPARQLDVYPQPVSMPQPAYPEQAIAAGMHGEVTLLVLVDEAGAVHEVSVVEAQPQGYFEAAALAAFQDLRFEPALKDGRPVRSRVLIKVAFDPGARP